MSKFIPNIPSGQHSGAHLNKLETSAEKNIGKEINVVNTKDFNHLDLIIEAKNNRLKSEFFYIYNYEKFNNCSLLKENFDVLASDQITHNSARYVIHYLTMELKKRFKEIRSNSKATKQEQNMIFDIFKPSLGQFDDADIIEANNFIRSLFPYEGCSFTGEKLEKLIAQSNWITLILSLRIVWSLLPNAIIPWKSFHKFTESEKRSNFTNKQSFYQVLPTFLPSHNHACVLFEFLEILLYIFSDNYFLDLNSSVDLIFTAGQICFNRDEFHPTGNQNDDDLNELQQFYYKRGYSFYQIFISYLRSLAEESSFNNKVILETFKINEYPPKAYTPVTQKALTLTVASDPDLTTTNYFKLISNASNATSRIYSSNHTFTKFENKFLDKFEVNPHKIIEHFFSKSSKNYLLKFDKNLNFENFKVGNDINEFRKNLKNGTLFENKELISTFINDFSRYGFEGNNNNLGQNESFVADTINFNFNSKMENVDTNPVRVSKLAISEWFINAWKYETFLGYLQNTVILKLTKTIGDCDWLIITSNDKVSANNRYLTPPSSADNAIDAQKEAELGQFGEQAEQPKESIDQAPKIPVKELLPALSTKKMKSPRDSQLQNGAKKQSPGIGPRSPKRKRSPKKADLKNISCPSPPKDSTAFSRDVDGSGSSNAKKPSLPVMKDLPTPKDTDLSNPVDAKHQSPERPLQSPMAEIIDVHADAQSQESVASYDDQDEHPLEAPGKLKEGDATPNTIASSPIIDTPSSSASYRSAKSNNTPTTTEKELPPLKESPTIVQATSAQVVSSPPIQQSIQDKKVSTPSHDSSFFYPPSGLKDSKVTSTPPQQVSHEFSNPPPLLKDSHNTSSLNSQMSKQILSQVDLSKPVSVPFPRPLQSPKNYPNTMPKSPVGSPARFNKGPVPAPVSTQGPSRSPKPHPYQQFQHQSPQGFSRAPAPMKSAPAPAPIAIPGVSANQSAANKGPTARQQFSTPPNRPIEKFQNLPSPQFNFTKPLSQPSSPNSIAPPSTSSSTEQLERPRRFSKLGVVTKDVQSQIKQFSQSNSPIGQAFPKFFKKASSENLNKMPNSASSNSLAHINDGSGTSTADKKRSVLLVNNPELDIKNIESIPEIPFTPRAIRESRSNSGSVETNRERSSSTVDSKVKEEQDLKKEVEENNADFNKLLSQNRESFTGETSSANTSRHSSEVGDKSLPDLLESHEGDSTQDTAKTDHLKIEQNLDGLLEEIKESLGSDKEKYFSTEDLQDAKTTSVNVN